MLLSLQIHWNGKPCAHSRRIWCLSYRWMCYRDWLSMATHTIYILRSWDSWKVTRVHELFHSIRYQLFISPLTSWFRIVQCHPPDCLTQCTVDKHWSFEPFDNVIFYIILGIDEDFIFHLSKTITQHVEDDFISMLLTEKWRKRTHFNIYKQDMNLM